MNTLSKHRSTKAGMVITLLLTLSLAIIGQVNAAFISCRSDPIVFLSDGTLLQFSNEVATSLDDLISVRYTLHVPAGVQLNRVIYTPKWASSKESVVLVNDQPANSYQLTILVQTGIPNVAVTVKSMMLTRGNGGIHLNRQGASGLSGQSFTVNF